MSITPFNCRDYCYLFVVAILDVFLKGEDEFDKNKPQIGEEDERISHECGGRETEGTTEQRSRKYLYTLLS